MNFTRTHAATQPLHQKITLWFWNRGFKISLQKSRSCLMVPHKIIQIRVGAMKRMLVSIIHIHNLVLQVSTNGIR